LKGQRFLLRAILVLSLGFFALGQVAANSGRLRLVAVYAKEASIKRGQHLLQGQSASTGVKGYLQLVLEPYRGVKVEAHGCTTVTVDTLRRSKSGVLLDISYGQPFLCALRSHFRLTSTFVSPHSRATLRAYERLISLSGTQGALSRTATGQLLIGLGSGSASVLYQGADVAIPAGFYIKSADGQPLSKPLRVKPFSLKSIGMIQGSSKHKLCTHEDHFLVSRKGYLPYTELGRLCLDTDLDDLIVEHLPTGLSQGWKFKGQPTTP